MNIEKARQFVYAYDELKKISHRLNNLYIDSCNFGLTDRQEKRQEKLQNEADRLGKKIGLKVYHQTDPRGASIYLIDKSMSDSNYTNGVCVW